ncbi:MAG: hypothetical protein IIC61_02410 [Proteobacteria bacterium]|nr:hypothetical protein [Pseudomonadota bacterium]
MSTMPPASAGQPLSPAPFTELTEVRVSVPVERPSQLLESIVSRDLRPDLLLVIRW